MSDTYVPVLRYSVTVHCPECFTRVHVERLEAEFSETPATFICHGCGQMLQIEVDAAPHPKPND